MGKIRERFKKAIGLGLAILLIFQNIIFPIHHVYANDGATTPVFRGLDIDKDEVTVGDKIKISLDLEFDQSRIKYLYLYYRMPITDKLKSFSLKYNNETGKYETVVTITNDMENGRWTTDYIYIWDQSGTIIRIYDERRNDEGVDLYDGDFTVTGTTGADIFDPVFKGIQIDYKEVRHGNKVKIIVDAEDADSGINRVSVTYKMPISGSFERFTLYYNNTSGKYEREIYIDDFIEMGRWQVYAIYIWDNANNFLNLLDNRSSSIFDTGDLSGGDFVVIDYSNPIPAIDQYKIVTQNEKWTKETINTDIYIGPEAVLRIDGDVTVNGDIYVLGAMVSYGDLTVNGTIYAQNFLWGWTTLYNGTVNFRGGKHSVSSLVATNRVLNDIPFYIYTEPLVATNGVIDKIEGATLPIGNLFVEGEKVDFRWNGTFYLENIHVRGKKYISFTFVDVFGNKITKELPLEIIDTIPPEVTVSTPGGYFGQSKEITFTLSEPATIYYTLNGDDPTVSSPKYTDPIVIDCDATLKYIAVDEYGNQTEIFVEEYKFFTVEEVTDASRVIYGKAQPYSTIIIQRDHSEWKAIADNNGDFEVGIPLLPAGTELIIYALDQFNVKSEKIKIIVKDVTSPDKPIVDEVTDQTMEITGKAEPETTVTVRKGDQVLGVGTADKDGSFKVPIPKQSANTKITVIATDKAGNESEATIVVVIDVTPPEKPVVYEITNKDTFVNGEAEPDVAIEVYANDEKIGLGRADKNGNFSIKISAQDVGTVLTVHALDRAGNKSVATEVTVADYYAPAQNTDNERIAGASRYHTAVQISQYGWENQSADTIIIAQGESFPDALAGSSLAYALNAPILLVKDRLIDVTIHEIKRLGAKKVIILGGEKAVSRNVENQLRNLGIKEIHRLAGGGRYETAVAIAEKLTVATQKIDTAILAYGMDFPDALSIAPYAAQRGYPILLTETSRLSAATKKYLDSNQNIKHVIIVGGNAVIDKNVEDELKKNVIRIDGNHRYDTAARVMKEFGEKPKKVYIANGYSFADALTGSVLAAKEGVPLLLVETDHVPGATAEATRKIRTFTILGGDKVVSEKVKNTLLKK